MNERLIEMGFDVSRGIVHSHENVYQMVWRAAHPRNQILAAAFTQEGLMREVLRKTTPAKRGADVA